MKLKLHGMKEVGMPLLLVEFQGKKMLMLLDSGSDTNYLDGRVFDYFKDTVEITKGEGYVIGVEGKQMARGDQMDMPMEVNGHILNAHFYSIPGGITTFDVINQECDVRIHGILGTPFMAKNNILIDFAKREIRIRFPALQTAC